MAYTSETLALYIIRQARGVAPALGWATPEDVSDIIDDTLLEYGVSSVEQATDERRLRILSRYFAWKSAVEQSAGKIKVSIGGQSWDRDKIQAQAKEAFLLAKDEAAPYLSITAVTEQEPANGTVKTYYLGSWSKDPYRSAR